MFIHNEAKYLVDNRKLDDVDGTLPKSSMKTKNESIHPEVMGVYFIDRNKERNETDNFVIRTIIAREKISKSWSIRKWGVEKAINDAVCFRANFLNCPLPPSEIIQQMVDTVNDWLLHGRPAPVIMEKLGEYERPELDFNFDKYISYTKNGEYLRVTLPFLNDEGKKEHHTRSIRVESVDQIPSILVILREFRERMLKADPRVEDYLRTRKGNKLDATTPIWSGITIYLQPSVGDAPPNWSISFTPPRQLLNKIPGGSWAVKKNGLEAALDLALEYQSKVLNKPKPDAERRERIIQYMKKFMDEKNILYKEDKLPQKRKKVKPRMPRLDAKDIIHNSVRGIYLNFKPSYWDTQADSHCIVARTVGTNDRAKVKSWSIEKYGIENAIRSAVNWRFKELKLPIPDEVFILEMISIVEKRYGNVSRNTVTKKSKAESIEARPTLDKETDRYISFCDSSTSKAIRLLLPYLEGGETVLFEEKYYYESNSEINDLLVKLREKREYLIQNDKRVSDYMYEKFGCLLEDGNPFLMGIHARRKPSRYTGILYWHIVVDPRAYTGYKRKRSWATNKWTLQGAVENALRHWAMLENKSYPDDKAITRIVNYFYETIAQRTEEYNAVNSKKG